jgi:hypothetical protein
MPMNAARKLNEVMRQSLSLAFWRRPRSPVVLVGFGAFLLACVVALLVYTLQDFRNTDPPANFYTDGLHLHASYFLCVLMAAWLAAWALKRPALWLTLASMTVLIGIIWMALAVQLPIWLADAEELQVDAWQILLALGLFVVLLRAVGFLARDTGFVRRFFSVLLLAAMLTGPWIWRQTAWLWYPPNDQEDEAVIDQADSPSTTPDFDPEALIYQQPALVQQRLDGLRAQTPGRIDLYALGFAGDGSEPVFRNEVDFFDELMAKRFGGEGRTLPLVNSPDTINAEPLATLSNLRATLAGIGSKMDGDEDILMLFLTSHGSEDHQLYVGMQPLALDQIDPQDLRAALDEAKIRWRVVVVSACYSGGFVDALRDPHTLVITSARSDRTSFGCGADSDITWFGKAFLTEALNQTTDFEQAFSLAGRKVREWELAQGQMPSVPQMAVGSDITAHLQEWRKGLTPGTALAFHPVVKPLAN